MSTTSSRASWIDVAAQRKADDERERRRRAKAWQKERYERWHIEETLDREPDNWLMTYLDLITLLLALFVVMLALTRLGSGLVAKPPEIATGVSLAKLPPGPVEPWAADLPVIPAAWANLKDPPPPAADNSVLAPTDPLEKPVPPVKMPTAEELGLSDLGKAVNVQISRQTVSFRISNELLFTSGQATLSKEGVPLIKKLADVVNRSKYPLSVEGHSDNVPILTKQFASNWDLSTSRATSVLRELVHDGVDPQRLRAVGYADTKPLESNDTPAGKAANRRVELIMRILPDAAAKPKDAVPQSAAAKPQDAAPQPAAAKPQDAVPQSAAAKPQDAVPQPAAAKPQGAAPQSAAAKPQDAAPQPAVTKPQDGVSHPPAAH